MKVRIWVLFLILFVYFFSPREIFAITYITDDISTPEIWTSAGSPYVISNLITVENNGSLTIEPGVIVKFDFWTSIDIEGNFSALGTSAAPIIFTSLWDDANGGDTNGDGASVPMEGDWLGLSFLDNGAPILMSNMVIQYSGNGIYLEAGTLEADNFLMNHNGSGVTAVEASFVCGECVWNDTFSDPVVGFNDSFIQLTATAIADYDLGDAIVVFDNSDLSAEGVTIESNSGNGGVVVFNDSTADIQNISIKDGSDGVVFFNAGDVSIEDSIIKNSDNGGIIDAGNSGGYDPSSLSVQNSQIFGNDIGIYLTEETSVSPSAGNAIYGNSTYAVLREDLPVVNFQNNWWGSASGPYHPDDNPGGGGDEVTDNVNFSGWLVQNPFGTTAPSLSGLGQFKSDGTFSISEGARSLDEKIVFKATVFDDDSATAKIQVELKDLGESFDGNELLESAFMPVGQVVSVSKSKMANGNYKWRARAMDSEGNFSSWQSFGIPNNKDFEIKLVPLYTQGQSPFPSEAETFSWFSKDYAQGAPGNYRCGFTIGKCGCAITSVVMILRYYDLINLQGKDVTPLTFNDWLNTNQGYISGDIQWPKVKIYSNNSIKYVKGENIFNNFSLLDDYLAQDYPVIAKEQYFKPPSPDPKTHFIVIDHKLTNTYGVKDPAWYNTKKLDEVATNTDAKIRDYNNQFFGLRLYEPNSNLSTFSSINISLASPAELLLTDPNGNRLGKDPITGTEFDEIVGGSYFSDAIDDPFEDTQQAHEIKQMYVAEPLDGEYLLEVIGTGVGNYSLKTFFEDVNSQISTSEIEDNTSPGVINDFVFTQDGEAAQNIELEYANDTPEARMGFDVVTKKLVIKGIDDGSTTVTFDSVSQIYTVTDDKGRKIELDFSSIEEGPNFYNATLHSISYNDGETILSSDDGVNFNYIWELDGSGDFQTLKQEILLPDGSYKKAGYTQSSGGTTITTLPHPAAAVGSEFVSGMAIINLETSNGLFEF